MKVMEKTKKLLIITLIICSLVGVGQVGAATKVGTLEITGVPEETVSGNYDPQEGVFKANVSEFPEALITVKFEEVRLFGQEMEWRTKDNYLIFKTGANLHKDDFKLTAEVIEYFGEEERLVAVGNVVAVTEDATVHGDRLVYNEKSDEAVFTGQVKVIFADGTVEGEKFLMLLEKGELQFFGAFQGEFKTDSSN